MKIYIPHLHYTIKVNFKATKYLNSVGLEACVLYNKNNLVLCLRREPKPIDFPTVAHEVLHLIQYICRDRNINMTEEIEHCGYLMQFILNKILKNKFEIRK
jgi:hypothetical protein